MADELQLSFPTGVTLYAVLANSIGQMWNGAAFEVPVAANWATYDITMPEVGATGLYQGDMPSVAAGVYSYSVRLQAGGAPAGTDLPVGVGSIEWDGTAVISLSGIVAAVLAALSALFPWGVTCHG